MGKIKPMLINRYYVQEISFLRYVCKTKTCTATGKTILKTLNSKNSQVSSFYVFISYRAFKGTTVVLKVKVYLPQYS